MIQQKINNGIEPRGDTIRIHFSYKGIRCRETLKLEPIKSNLKLAAMKLAEVNLRIREGKFVYADHFPNSKLAKKFGSISSKHKYKCKELLERLLSEYEHLAAKDEMSISTFVIYRRVINYKLIPVFGDYYIYELTPSLIREWITLIGRTAKTIKNCLTPLRAMLDEALNEGLIQVHPLNKLALPKILRTYGEKSEYQVKPFLSFERDEIIAKAEGQFKNLIQFGFWSGLRTSELIALKWQDIDIINGVANICRAKVFNTEKTTKTKAGVRKLILLPKALEALLNQAAYTKNDKRGFIFHNPSTNAPWGNSNKIGLAWNRVLKQCNVEYRNSYQMRHTYASMLLSNGENPLFVAKQMGHVNTEMIFKVYGKWLPTKDDSTYNFVGKY